MQVQSAPQPPRRHPAQILVIFALALVGITAFMGMVLDGGNIFVQRRTAQTAADAAVLAGVATLRDATLDPNPDIADAVCQYALLNAFGTTPKVTRAYFIGTNGAAIAGGTFIDHQDDCLAPPDADIPNGTAGIKVETSIGPFSTYLLGVVGIPEYTATGIAAARVEVLTGFDNREAPFIICGGIDGVSLWLANAQNTPVVNAVRTTTAQPGVWVTSSALPQGHANNYETQDDFLLVANGTPPPQYVVDKTREGRVYVIFDNGINEEGDAGSGDCGANSSTFSGDADDVQPTPFELDLNDDEPDIMNAGNGANWGEIEDLIVDMEACRQGTNADAWVQGGPGCVMVLPIAYSASKQGKGVQAEIGGFGMFYTFCYASNGGQCQVVVGQYLGPAPARSGTTSATWTWGSSAGGPLVVKMTE